MSSLLVNFHHYLSLTLCYSSLLLIGSSSYPSTSAHPLCISIMMVMWSSSLTWPPLLVTCPWYLVHVFPIVLPWLLVHIYRHPVVASFQQWIPFPSILPSQFQSDFIIEKHSLSLATIPSALPYSVVASHLVSTHLVSICLVSSLLVTTTQCGP